MDIVHRRKGSIRQTWSHKRNEAKQAYESMLFSRQKAEIFNDWVQTGVFLTRKYRSHITKSILEG